jgi:hypothetical protein
MDGKAVTPKTIKIVAANNIASLLTKYNYHGMIQI